MWGTPQKKAEATLKQALTQAPALRLPDPEKAFQLYVHEREGIALGVLTQRLGSEPQPVAYLSKRLDPTSRGWPPCLRNLAAIAIMIEDALKLSFGGKLTIFTSHQVKQLLNGRGHLLSPCLFNLYAEYIMKNLDWMKHKLESRLPGEISITSDMQMTPPLWQKVKRN